MPDIAIIGAGFSGLGVGDPPAAAGDRRLRRARARTTTSAAPGGRTPIRAAPATCRRTSTRSPSRRTRSGARRTRRSPRSAPTCSGCADAHDLYRSIRLGTTVTVGGVGRRRRPLDARDLRRPGQRARAHRRHGPADRAAHPGAARARPLRGRRLPLRPLGPRPRPARRARRRDRHRRVRDPVRPRDPARGRRAARVPAHPAVGHAAHQPPHHRRRAPALPPPPRAAEGGPRRRLRRARGARARVRQEPAAMAIPERLVAAPHARADPRSRAAGAGDARLHDRLQAHPASNGWYPALGKPNVELVTERDPRGPGALDRRRRRERARGRHDHLRHRLPRRRHADRRVGPRPRRHAARRRLGGQPARAPRHDGRRLPEPVPAARPQHRAWATARWST